MPGRSGLKGRDGLPGTPGIAGDPGLSGVPGPQGFEGNFLIWGARIKKFRDLPQHSFPLGKPGDVCGIVFYICS